MSIKTMDAVRDAQQNAPAIPKVDLVGACAPINHASDFGKLCAGLNGTAFQTPHWLACWFEIFGRDAAIEGFWLTLKTAQGETVLAMPLIRYCEGGLRIVSFADLGVCDYNAPLLGPSAEAYAPRDLRRALLAALPEGDLFIAEHLPEKIGARLNPLVGHSGALPARQSCWAIDLPRDWADFRPSLSSSVRESLAKKWRKFERLDGSEFLRAREAAQAHDILQQLEAMQESRMGEIGKTYCLSAPRMAAFYRQLVTTGIEDGYVFISALKCKGEVVAANFGIRHANKAYYLRVGNLFGEWASFSPGAVVTEFAIKSLHADGIDHFDFTRGEYEYKRRFRAYEIKLIDLMIPLSWRGWLPAIQHQLRRRLRHVQWLRQLTGRDGGSAKAAKAAPNTSA